MVSFYFLLCICNKIVIMRKVVRYYVLFYFNSILNIEQLLAWLTLTFSLKFLDIIIVEAANKKLDRCILFANPLILQDHWRCKLEVFATKDQSKNNKTRTKKGNIFLYNNEMTTIGTHKFGYSSQPYKYVYLYPIINLMQKPLYNMCSSTHHSFHLCGTIKKNILTHFWECHSSF